MSEVISGLIIEALKPVLPLAVELMVSSLQQSSKAESGMIETEVLSIKEAWEVPLDTEICIQGTLSPFLPLVVGKPSLKKQIHLQFREMLNEGSLNFPTDHIHAYLSYTSGQMIWRPKWTPESGHIMLGLYQCIVRNSILVLLSREVYERVVLPNLPAKAPFINVQIKGYVSRIPAPWLQFLRSQVSIQRIRGEVIEEGRFIWVRNAKDIKILGRPWYLDGDIWAAVEYNGKQAFITRFLNLIDVAEFDDERKKLVSQIRERKVIFFFDQQEHFDGDQVITLDDIIKRFGQEQES